MSSIGENQLLPALNNQRDSSIVGLVKPTYTEDDYYRTPSGQYMPASAAVVKNYQKLNVTNLNPVSASSIANAFQTNNSSYIEFQLPQLSGPVTKLDIVHNWTVSGAGVTLVPTYLMYRQCDIYFGGTVVETYSNANELAMDILFSVDDYNKLESFTFAHNTNMSWANQALTPGNYTKILSLQSTFLSALKPITQTLRQNIVIRLYFDSWANISTAGVVGDITCTSMFLNLSYDQYPLSWANQKMNWIANNEIVVPFISPMTFQVNTGPITFASGTSVQFPLTSVSDGYVAGFQLYVQNTTYSAAAKNNVDLSNFTISILDNSGIPRIQPQTGFYINADSNYERNDVALCRPSQTMKIYNIGLYKSNNDLSEGQGSGGYYHRSTDKLVLVPSITGGTYNVQLIVLYYKKVSQRDGQIYVTQ